MVAFHFLHCSCVELVPQLLFLFDFFVSQPIITISAISAIPFDANDEFIGNYLLTKTLHLFIAFICPHDFYFYQFMFVT